MSLAQLQPQLVLLLDYLKRISLLVFHVVRFQKKCAIFTSNVCVLIVLLLVCKRDTICVLRKPSRWDFLAPVLCFLQFLLTVWLDQNVNSSTDMQNTPLHHSITSHNIQYQNNEIWQRGEGDFLAHFSFKRTVWFSCGPSSH